MSVEQVHRFDLLCQSQAHALSHLLTGSAPGLGGKSRLRGRSLSRETRQHNKQVQQGQQEEHDHGDAWIYEQVAVR
jgi:hypothetical protein